MNDEQLAKLINEKQSFEVELRQLDKAKLIAEKQNLEAELRQLDEDIKAIEKGSNFI